MQFVLTLHVNAYLRCGLAVHLETATKVPFLSQSEYDLQSTTWIEPANRSKRAPQIDGNYGTFRFRCGSVVVEGELHWLHRSTSRPIATIAVERDIGVIYARYVLVDSIGVANRCGGYDGQNGQDLDVHDGKATEWGLESTSVNILPCTGTCCPNATDLVQ